MISERRNQTPTVGRNYTSADVGLSGLMSRLQNDDRLPLRRYVDSIRDQGHDLAMGVYFRNLGVTRGLEIWTIGRAQVYIITSGSDVTARVLLPGKGGHDGP